MEIFEAIKTRRSIRQYEEGFVVPVEDVKQIDIVNTLPRSMSTDDIFDFVKKAY